jgi:hypothetical protein
MLLPGPSDTILASVFAHGLDAESARYRLLAYIQRVRARYGEHKLYPHLEDLRGRLQAVRELRQLKADLRSALRAPLMRLDLERTRLVRSSTPEHAALEVMDRIIDEALPELDRAFCAGTELRDELAGHIRFEPVGLLPLFTREGYLLLRQGPLARAYAYTLVLPAGLGEADPSASIRTQYIMDYTISLATTYHHVKSDLVRHFEELPNPAVFAFTTDIALPAVETFVPLAKQLVYEVIACR